MQEVNNPTIVYITNEFSIRDRVRYRYNTLTELYYNEWGSNVCPVRVRRLQRNNANNNGAQSDVIKRQHLHAQLQPDEREFLRGKVLRQHHKNINGRGDE